MHNLLSSTAAIGLATILLAAGSAFAQTTTPDVSKGAVPAGWMSVGAIVAKLEGQGYVVREIDTDDGVFEVKAVDRNGVRVEADLDPATGEPLGRWKQDN